MCHSIHRLSCDGPRFVIGAAPISTILILSEAHTHNANPNNQGDAASKIPDVYQLQCGNGFTAFFFYSYLHHYFEVEYMQR
jgi:hypothetical protein